jgi:hypothetical protein
MKTLFVSYAREDKHWADVVLAMLEPLRSLGGLDVFLDRELAPGSSWEPSTLDYLQRCDGILVLASAAYCAPHKTFIREREFPIIRDRVQSASSAVHLTWLPLDDFACQPAGAGNGILGFLQAHQTAHGLLSALDAANRPGSLALDKILLQVKDHFSRWSRFEPVEGKASLAKPSRHLNARQVKRLERIFVEELEGDLHLLPIGTLGQDEKGGKRLTQLPLEQIYVSLSADPRTLEDRFDLQSFFEEVGADGEASEGGRKRNLEEVLAEARSRPAPPEAEEEQGPLSLEEAFRKHPILVLLGDPGSGKSVLCRWLSLQLARHLRAERSAAPARLPAVDLGPPRLPIRIRISELLPWLQNQLKHRGRASSLDFLDALDAYAEVWVTENRSQLQGSELAAVFRQAITDHRAAILLDGLDEVAQAADRAIVCEMVADFIDRHVDEPEGGSTPAEIGGNQILVTTRPAGYDLAPLSIDDRRAAHFRIRPFDEKQVELFCENLGKVLAGQDPQENLGKSFMKDLRSSPLPGLDRLTRRPLLLTALLAYWYPRRSLPKSRSDLYQAILLDLCARWRSWEAILQRFSAELRAYFDDDPKILDWLGWIAEEIHLRHPTGRIYRVVMQNFVLDRLLPKIEGKHLLELDDVTARRMSEDLPALLDLICTQTGALTEVAPEVFSFLHLTFQEYLVGRNLVRRLPAADPEKVLVGRFLPWMTEPRWREPLLFAFGELGLMSERGTPGPDRQRFLERLQQEAALRPGLATGSATLIADLLRELPAPLVTLPEIAIVLRSLVEVVAAEAARPSILGSQIVERIAERRQEEVEAGRGAQFDRLALALMDAEPRLAPVVAEIFGQRGWLSAEWLEGLAGRLRLDSTEWGWPIRRILRWVRVPPEDQPIPDPAGTFALPKGDAASERARQRYEMHFESWERALRAKGQRQAGGSLRPAPCARFFAEHDELWQRLISLPECARAVVALCWPVADLQCAHWNGEYLRLAAFLEQSDFSREEIVDREPEFVVRWGPQDPIYNCAVYLDTVSVPRMTRLRGEEVRLEAAEILARWPRRVEELLMRSARSPTPEDELREGLLDLVASGDAELHSAGAIGLAAMGIRLASDAVTLAAAEETVAALADAVFRGIARETVRWFQADGTVTPERFRLSPAERRIVFRALTRQAVLALGLPTTIPVPPPAEELSPADLAEALTSSLAGGVSPSAENTQAWQARVESLEAWRPLVMVAAILRSANAIHLKRINVPTRPPLWGVSGEERLYPPEALLALEEFAIATGQFSEEFRNEFFLTLLRETPVEARPGGFIEEGFLENGLLSPEAMLEALQGGNTAGESPTDPSPFPQAVEIDTSWEWGWDAGNGNWELLQDLVLELAKVSLLDAILIRARLATRCGNPEKASRLLRDCLEDAALLEDAETAAELLARLEAYCANDPELEERHRIAADRLESPLLQAYALDKLEAYLASDRFHWNSAGVFGKEPAWVVTATFLSLQSLLDQNLNSRRPAIAKNAEAQWQRLRADPSLELAREIARQGGDQGLLCTRSALEAVEALAEKAGAELVSRQAAERLLPLLAYPPPSLASRIQQALRRDEEKGRSAGRDQPAQRRRLQHTLLLAEASRALEVEHLDALLDQVELGDDFSAIRAELALAGPWRALGRAHPRRFSVENHGIEVLAALSLKRSRFCPELMPLQRRLIAAAVGDWLMDSSPALADLCTRASGDPTAEEVLSGILRCCDAWTPECQQIAADWLSAAERPQSPWRQMLLEWVAGRQQCKLIPGEAWLSDHLLRPDIRAALAEERACPDSQVGERAPVVAVACLAGAAGSESVERALARFESGLIPVYQGSQIDAKALSSRLTNGLNWLGDQPETRWPLIAPICGQPSFRSFLAAWLLESLQEWLARENDAPPDDLLRIRLEELLCFASCLAVYKPNAFSRFFKPEAFLAPLAQACFKPTGDAGHLAAVTLISRLRFVDLDQVLPGSSERPATVLEALLHGLRGGAALRRRLGDSLPFVFELRGARAFQRFEEILLARGESLPAGSLVLGTAEILARLLETAVISAGDQRARGLELLKEAAAAERNQRPLFGQIGNGDVRSPIELKRIGWLGDALKGVFERL